jgi:hypothetical protein
MDYHHFGSTTPAMFCTSEMVGCTITVSVVTGQQVAMSLNELEIRGAVERCKMVWPVCDRLFDSPITLPNASACYLFLLLLSLHMERQVPIGCSLLRRN